MFLFHVILVLTSVMNPAQYSTTAYVKVTFIQGPLVYIPFVLSSLHRKCVN